MKQKLAKRYDLLPNLKFIDVMYGSLRHPVMIVGQNPGRQRRTSILGLVWEGNRSADLLKDCIDGLENLVLTNVCNYQEMTPERIDEGLKELKGKISYHRPRKIICLGRFAFDHVYDLVDNAVVVGLHHPSYIARFNKDRELYKQQLRKEIEA